ncbi:hypothetical protein [Burkholderia stagnalis]|uniref:hypothetical protein n=1 Tax=Burkholderia stagnalis TaxID=1503054 RepID=UPI0012D9E30F|nr:hypothetical protein [Burkholderia stagnalis]
MRRGRQRGAGSDECRYATHELSVDCRYRVNAFTLNNREFNNLGRSMVDGNSGIYPVNPVQQLMVSHLRANAIGHAVDAKVAATNKYASRSKRTQIE